MGGRWNAKFFDQYSITELSHIPFTFFSLRCLHTHLLPRAGLPASSASCTLRDISTLTVLVSGLPVAFVIEATDDLGNHVRCSPAVATRFSAAVTSISGLAPAAWNVTTQIRCGRRTALQNAFDPPLVAMLVASGADPSGGTAAEQSAAEADEAAAEWPPAPDFVVVVAVEAPVGERFSVAVAFDGVPVDTVLADVTSRGLAQLSHVPS